jgi:hypothetical protein
MSVIYLAFGANRPATKPTHALPSKFKQIMDDQDKRQGH